MLKFLKNLSEVMIMYERKILRYAMNGEPFVIESPSQKKAEVEEAPPEEELPKGPSEEELARLEKLKNDEENVQRMLEEAFAKSKEADEKLKEADFQSKQLIQDTQNECDQIIADTKKMAEEDAQTTHDEAYKQGHDEGFKDGHEEGYKTGVEQGREDGEKAVREEMADAVKAANAKAEKTIQDAKEQTADYFVRAEDDVAKVVMLAIEKILPQHFLDVPQVVLPIVREVIQIVRDQKEIKVHVEPESYDLVLMARSEFQNMLTDSTALLEIISDDTLKPGDVVVETPNGGIDAKLATQIELMKGAIQAVLSE